MKEQKGKVLNKIKKAFFSGKKATFAMLAFTISTVLSLSAATFAWFALTSQSSSTIQTFSGDLNVSIDKVTAYKYVYPYHRNSNEFVDYDAAGAVKSYVVEDASVDVTGDLSDTVTIALSIGSSQPYATLANDANIGPTKVHYETSQDFNYYLIGNSVFNGVDNNPWSTLTATSFSRRETPTVSDSVIVENIVVSSGSEFVLFDAHTVAGSSCNYFEYDSITPETNKVSRFEIVDDNRIKCLKSGIYSFEYYVNALGDKFLDITLTSRSDNATIGTNMIDPTKISIDYRGGSISTITYPTIESYLSTGIQEQKTMVVLDVQLKYQNKNKIDAGLKVIREAESNQSIYHFTGKYSTTDSYTYQGYVDSSHRNPLKASDFYSFYFEFAKQDNAYASGTAAWNALHALKTDYQVASVNQFQKFQNDTSFDTSFESVLHPKTNGDSAIIPASALDNIYHCYIAIDYDYEYMSFFIEQNRLGKTYLLDRDFGFVFSGVQHVEANPQSSSSSGGGN